MIIKLPHLVPMAQAKWLGRLACYSTLGFLISCAGGNGSSSGDSSLSSSVASSSLISSSSALVISSTPSSSSSLVTSSSAAPSGDGDKDDVIDSGDTCPNTALAAMVDGDGCSSYQRGAKHYVEQNCASCHGDDGEGQASLDFPAINEHACSAKVPGNCANIGLLATYIAGNMPRPGACTDSCATDVATYMVAAFAPTMTAGDADNDSIPDNLDQCPNTTRDERPTINEKGCANIVEVKTVVFALNAGGDAYTAQDGTQYQADNEQFYSGSAGETGGNPSHAIASTEDDELYRKERFGGALQYTIPVDNGTYEVALHMAEVYHEENGKRLFDILIEEQKRIDDLDLFATAGGKNVAYTATFSDIAVNDGELTIALSASVDNGSLTAFKISKIAPNDGDGDGLEDIYDNCPGSQSTAAADTFGCTVAQNDRDNDGIPLVDDKCPETPAGQTGSIDASGPLTGCSAQERQADSDLDGIADVIDRCPSTPADKLADVGNSGCTGTENPLPAGAIESPQMRLTTTEYRNTIKAAFNVNSLPEVSLQSDEKGPFKTFTNNAAETTASFKTLVTAAQGMATALAPSIANQCNWQNNARGCVANHLQTPMKTLYRTHTINAAQLDGLATIISDAFAQKADAEQAVGAAIARMLIDLNFTFRLEMGDMNIAGTQSQLTPRELANRLSYWLNESAPDAQLMAQTHGNDTINNRAVYEQHVDRLIAGNTFKNVARALIFEWLGLSTTPRSTDLNTIDGASFEETRRLVDHVIDNQLPLRELFAADYSFINNTLASHYNINAPSNDWARTNLPSDSLRQGILTHAYFLASHGNHSRDKNTIFRGKVIFERIFCKNMPPAPDGAIAAAELISDRSIAKACAGCHEVVDPIGRIFDIYDQTGKTYASTELEGFLGLDVDIYGAYDNGAELSNAISQSQAMPQCFAQQLYRAALGRDPQAIEQNSFDQVFASVAADSSIHQIIKTFVMSESFKLLHAKSHTNSCQQGN